MGLLKKLVKAYQDDRRETQAFLAQVKAAEAKTAAPDSKSSQAESSDTIATFAPVLASTDNILDQHEYRMFTQPAELHKAINTLRGIVSGLSTDHKINNSEIQELLYWVSSHQHLRTRHPFSEILPVVEDACNDGVVTEDEANSILWICSSFSESGSYFDSITSSIQFLLGLIHGIMADSELSDTEILSLQKWMEANSYLSATYPYDAIYEKLSIILSDKRIDQTEREALIAFFSTLIEFKNSCNLSRNAFDDLREDYSVSGIFSKNPEILFEGKTFIFTGDSQRATRQEMTDIAKGFGAKVTTKVSGKTDYLVVGRESNPCWKYACYGNKINDALAFQSKGSKVQIVCEDDFWAAVGALS